MRATNRSRESAALLGVAFDAQDGQTRLTRGKNFALVGGSEETHAVMRETAVKVNEHADRKGKTLAEVSAGELRDICQQVSEAHGLDKDKK